jgi:hypothetical protein
MPCDSPGWPQPLSSNWHNRRPKTDFTPGIWHFFPASPRRYWLSVDLCFSHCSHAYEVSFIAEWSSIKLQLAMQTAHGNLHLEIQTSRKSPVGILRTSFRENGKMKHTQHGRITGCSLQQVKILQLAFRERVVPVDDPQAFKILSSREYGASYSILAIAKQLGLHKVFYSRPEPWVSSALAMIVGRLVYSGSKLSLCNHHPNTCLWELCGVTESPDVDVHCYETMDTLLQRQGAIQKNLAQRHIEGGHLVLYDITSVYFEGEYKDSELVTFGYNRDGKKGHEQIVVGLICNGHGCPVGVEVYAGNTKDETTVIEKVHEIKADYGIEKIIFVGDRGMITHSNIEALKEEKDLQTIGALTHGEMLTLLKEKVITLTCSMSATSMRSLTPRSRRAVIACAATRKRRSARAPRANSFWISPPLPWPRLRPTNAQRRWRSSVLVSVRFWRNTRWGSSSVGPLTPTRKMSSPASIACNGQLTPTRWRRKKGSMDAISSRAMSTKIG